MLRVVFDDGKVVLYDVGDDIKHVEDFKALSTTCGLWPQAALDSSRTCVFWNERIDLASDTIYEYGQPIAEDADLVAEPPVRFLSNKKEF